MTRVAVDGRPLYSRHSRQRGIGRYLSALLTGLGETQAADVEVLAPRGTAVPAGVELMPVRRLAPDGAPVFSYTADRLSDWEHLRRLPGEIARSGAGVFHSPATDPPMACPVPWVQTLLDVTPLALSREPDVAAERWRTRMSPIREADAVIAISRSTAEDGVRLLGLDPARVHVVHCGVSQSFSLGPRDRRAAPGYLLYVGQWGPNKGYAEAFAVAAAVAATGRPERLRVAGRLRPVDRPQVEGLLQATGAGDVVDLLDYVTEDDLPALYRGASVLLMTSRYEGFGFPLLEAMAAGTPVVTFDNSSLPEVGGGAAALVADGDTAAMTEEVLALLEDDAGWRDHSARGVERAATFTWEKSAAGHAEVYDRVARGGR